LDGETGLHYFGARYYDSQTTAFLSIDPYCLDSDSKRIALEISCPIYRLGLNPVRFTDPSGLKLIDKVKVNYTDTAGKIADKLASAAEWKIVPVSPRGMGGGTWLQRAYKATFTEGGYWRGPPGSVKAREMLAGKEGMGIQLTALKDVVTGGVSEIYDRGYTMEQVADAYKNMGENIKFGIENPDVAIDALTEGVTSTTAITINTLTGVLSAGFLQTNITGQEIQETINIGVNWILGN
jgi:RHS repeat-associated protein